MNKILEYFIKNKIIVSLILILIIIAGIGSMFSLRQEIFPPTDIDTMIVNVKYPGASTIDVEMNSVIPIENQIRTINGIKDYVSLSFENGAIIYIYLDTDIANKQAVKDEVYRKLSNVPDLSPDVEEVEIIDANPKNMSVCQIGITINENGLKDKEKSERLLYKYSDKLEAALLKIKGVGEVRVNGYRDREIKIYVDNDKMNKYYISLNEVIKSIQSRNIRATGGTLQSVHKEKNIVTIGQFKKPLDVKNVIIRSSYEEKRVLIKDIAKVKDGFKDANILIRVNRKPGVTLYVVKKENADVVKTVKNVKKFLKQYKKNSPKIFNVSIIEDRSLSIVALLDVVKSNAMIGFLLIFIVLLIFLDFKSAFWTAMGIPVTIFMIMIYMGITDISLNLISLGAVITVLGMLVDHGIVISENIYSYKTQGFSSSEAALLGTKEVLAPVTVTILTTIVAFLPLLYVKGIMGKFIRPYPIIISAALIASFLEAIFFLPNHLSHGKDIKSKPKEWFNPVIKTYRKALSFFLRYRYAVLGGFILIFIFSIFISRESIKNYTLFWDNTSDAFYINLEAPSGTSLEKTKELTKRVEKIVLKKIKKSELISMRTTIGHHTVKRINSKGNHENWSQITLYLVPKTERERSVMEIMRSLRKSLNKKKIPYFEKILFAKQIIGPSPGAAIELKIGGETREKRVRLQKDIERLLKSINGVKDIDNDQKAGKEEIVLTFNYKKLAQLNMDVATVAQTIRAAYEGVIATYIQTEKERLDFRVEIDSKFTRNEKFLLDLLIPNKQGRLIRLREVAAIKKSSSMAFINHYNGERVITITAKVDKKVTTSGKVVKKIKQFFYKNKDKYPGVYIKFKGEAAETKESMKYLIFAFILALFAVYTILVLLFQSLAQPLIVLLTIPFGLVGVLLAFTIHNMPLSFMAIVGVIGLSGVVVNDSVVMVDFINRLIKKEIKKIKNLDRDGIIKLIVNGAEKRLRPIILTTVTTVAGLLPTVYGIGGDVRSLKPTVMALTYGILFATLLTLILIPSLYLISFDIKKKFHK